MLRAWHSAGRTPSTTARLGSRGGTNDPDNLVALGHDCCHMPHHQQADKRLTFTKRDGRLYAEREDGKHGWCVEYDEATEAA